MQSLRTSIPNLCYIEDKDLFYDKKTKEYYSESDLTMMAQVEDLSSSALKNSLKNIKALRSITSQDLNKLKTLSPAKAKKQAAKEALANLYQDLAPSLRFYRANEDLAVGLYEANERGEVRRRGECEPTRFTELILSTKRLLTRLRDLAKEASDLDGTNLRNLAQALYDLFCSDPDNLLEGEPPQLAFDYGPAFRVLDSSLIKSGPHPTWDQFLQRLSHAETFKAFVWSVFEPENCGRQVLWLYGAGNDGKSSVLNTIADFYGRHATLTLNDKFGDDSFFFGQAYGKRLALYMDCNNTQIIRHNRIKSLTGGDTVSINEKFQAAYSARVYSRLFVASNYLPSIDIHEASERTRLLLIDVEPRPNNEMGDQNFVTMLQSEVGHFLYSCKVSYSKQCPNGANLLVPDEMAARIETACVSDDTNALDEFIESQLVREPESFVSRTELDKAFKRFLASNYVGNNGFRTVHLIRRLNKVKGVQLRRVGPEGARVRGFQGIGLRSST